MIGTGVCGIKYNRSWLWGKRKKYEGREGRRVLVFVLWWAGRRREWVLKTGAGGYIYNKEMQYNDLFSFCSWIRTFPTKRYFYFSSDILHVANPILNFYGFLDFLACFATEWRQKFGDIISFRTEKSLGTLNRVASLSFYIMKANKITSMARKITYDHPLTRNESARNM